MNPIIENLTYPADEPQTQIEVALSVLNILGRENIISTNSGLYQWNDDGVWDVPNQLKIQKVIQNYLKDTKQYKMIKDNNIKSIYNTLIRECYDESIQLDCGDDSVINCLSGHIHFDPNTGEVTLAEHQKTDYRTMQIPHKYDPNATAPLFDKFLNDLFDGDIDADQKKQFILEMIGYSLVTHNRFNKLTFFVGSGSNGKSVLLKTIEKLFSEDRFSTVNIDDMQKEFHTAHLDGKYINIVSEINHDSVLPDSKIKALTSGDIINAGKKFKDTKNINPFVKLWFACNNLPIVKDKSQAIRNRSFIIEFNRVFNKDTAGFDPHIDKKLAKELTGIFTIAVQAYSNVVQKNQFTTPITSVEAVNEWFYESNPVGRFINEYCTKDKNHAEKFSVIQNHFEKWLRDEELSYDNDKNGYLNITKLSKDLQSAGLQKLPRTSAGFSYQGVRLPTLNISSKLV